MSPPCISTCGARPGEKIKSLAFGAALSIDAISVGVRTITGEPATGAAVFAGGAAGGGNGDSGLAGVAGAESVRLAISEAGVRVGASMQNPPPKARRGTTGLFRKN